MSTERARLVFELLDKVDEVLKDVSHPLKVLVALRLAASYSIANGVALADFADAAGEIFKDTHTDILEFAREQEAAEASQ